MKKIKKLLCLFLCAVLFCCVTGCNKGDQFDFINMSVFSTSVRIEVHDGRLTSGQKQEIRSLLKGLDERYSTTKEGSFVSRFNALSTGQSIKMTDEEKTLLSLAKEYYALSSGNFSPAVYPLMRVWGFVNNAYENMAALPSDTDVKAAAALANFDLVEIEENANGTFIKKAESALIDTDDIEIDYGGFLKGYASQLVADFLLDLGFKKGYVNIGGSSLNLLQVDNLGVRHPDAKSGYTTFLSINGKYLTDKAVSTSGTYERYYTVENATVHHLIDPNGVGENGNGAGYPSATGIISATLICSDGAFADAMTTALCLADYTGGTANEPTTSPNSTCELTELVAAILQKDPSAAFYIAYQKDGQKLLLTNKEKDVHFTLTDTTWAVKQL